MTGIYQITNQITNVVYIGQAQNLERRRIKHVKEAAEEVGVYYTSILRNCRGVTKSSAGFLWEYA